MSIRQVAMELGVSVAVARKAAREVYGASKPRPFNPRQVRFIRWVLTCSGQLSE